MPVAFSDGERDHITAELKAAGRRLFTTVGLRKTALADLVVSAGIVKSTFYSFFDSKEALYLELLLDQFGNTRRLTVEEGLNAGTGTLDALRRYLRGAVTVLDTDPLYRRLVTHPEEMAMVQRKLGPDAFEQVGDSGLSDLMAFVTDRQTRGELPKGDPTIVVGALRAVLLLPLHAHEFGEDYPKVLDMTIDALTAGLVHDPR